MRESDRYKDDAGAGGRRNDRLGDSGDSRPPEHPWERESIWSIPRRLRLWYVGLFSGQFLALLVLVILEQYLDLAWVTHILNIYRAMSPIILPMVGSAYVLLEAIMLAEWLRERDRRKAEEMKQEGIVAGRQEGIAAGREEGIVAGRQEGIAAGREEGIVAGRQEGIAAGRQEGIAAGRQEGIVAGRQERDREWLAWYERLQAAQRDGRPFTEPPPVEPEDGNGA